MELKQIKANLTELRFQGGRWLILFSYDTPVACSFPRIEADNTRRQSWCVTDTKHSKTTSGHINFWLDYHSVWGNNPEPIPQGVLDSLVFKMPAPEIFALTPSA